jgi:hypothetical protein
MISQQVDEIINKLETHKELIENPKSFWDKWGAHEEDMEYLLAKAEGLLLGLEDEYKWFIEYHGHEKLDDCDGCQRLKELTQNINKLRDSLGISSPRHSRDFGLKEAIK